MTFYFVTPRPLMRRSTSMYFYFKIHLIQLPSLYNICIFPHCFQTRFRMKFISILSGFAFYFHSRLLLMKGFYRISCTAACFSREDGPIILQLLHKYDVGRGTLYRHQLLKSSSSLNLTMIFGDSVSVRISTCFGVKPADCISSPESSTLT